MSVILCDRAVEERWYESSRCVINVTLANSAIQLHKLTNVTDSAQGAINNIVLVGTYRGHKAGTWRGDNSPFICTRIGEMLQEQSTWRLCVIDNVITLFKQRRCAGVAMSTTWIDLRTHRNKNKTVSNKHLLALAGMCWIAMQSAYLPEGWLPWQGK